MGGTAVGLWGDWAGHGTEVQYAQQTHGRWTGVRIRGLAGCAWRIFSCYRPPSSSMAGSLHQRLAHALGISSNDVTSAFYTGLSAEIRAGREAGDLIVVGGDMNADPADPSSSGSRLAAFCESANLLPLGVRATRQASGPATYVHPGTQEGHPTATVIDHILLSHALHNHSHSKKTCVIKNRTLGHRGVSGVVGTAGTASLGFSNASSCSRREWVRAVRAQSRELWKRANILASSHGDAFRAALAPLPAEVEANISSLEELVTWGREAWRSRSSMITSTEPTPHSPSAYSRSAWLGLTYGDMLDQAQQLASMVETALGQALLQAAKKVHPRKGRPMSRRTCGGWYAGIDEDRRRIHALDRAIGNAALGRLSAALKWAGRAGVNTAGSLAEWVDKSKQDLAAIKRRKQGRQRAAWAAAGHGRWERLKKAAISGDAGTMARAYRNKRSQGILREVEVEPGRWARGARDVQAAATRYFEDAFAGRSVAQAPLQQLLADSDEGRLLRARAAQGELPAEWEHCLGPATYRRLQDMCRRKEVAGATMAPGWHTDWLRSISMEEWRWHWAGRRRTSAPGPSGVGPDVWKEAPPVLHDLAIRLYSACLALCVQPDSWKRETIVPIPKKAGATSLNQLRPLKLLEVTKKAVLAIVKRRMATELEAKGVLDDVQCGFRPGFSCATAAIRMQALFESSRRHHRELHVVLLDIEKAYDSVQRSWGKGIALSRLAVDEAVIEWFTESDRDTCATVRTGWEPYLRSKDHTIPVCWPRCGFTQGAPESPLLWNIFYDMIIAQLQREGVGQDVLLLNGAGSGESQGLGVFADDTAVWSRSSATMTSYLSVIQGVLELVGLRVAAHKSEHMCLRWDRGQRGLQFVLLEEEDSCVYMGGTRVPSVEFDVGLRYLGYWMDVPSDYGEQTHVLEQRVASFSLALARARLPPAVALYLYRSVLTPQVLYPLALATLTFHQIEQLEAGAWKLVAGKLGCYPNMAAALRHMPVEQGGLGLVPWWWMVLRTRVDLLAQWGTHSAPWIRAIYEELSAGWVQDSLGRGQGGLGKQLLDKTDQAWCNHRLKTWMGSIHSLVTGAGASLDIPSLIRPPRAGDRLLGGLSNHSLRERHWTLTRREHVLWLSDIRDNDGGFIPFAEVPGWGFLRTLLRSADDSTRDQPIGAWSAHQSAASLHLISPGHWVMAQGKLGKLASWKRHLGQWEAEVRWAPGGWQRTNGRWHIWGGALDGPGPWPVGEGASSWLAGRDIKRLWGLRADPEVYSSRLQVWIWDSVSSHTTASRLDTDSLSIGRPALGEPWHLGSSSALRSALHSACALGLPIFAASDGSLTHTWDTGDSTTPVAHCAAGWAVGIGSRPDVDGRRHGEVQWLAASSAQLPAAGLEGTESSFRAEVGGAIMIGRVLATCLGQHHESANILHVVDNQALVSLWQRRRLTGCRPSVDLPDGFARQELSRLRTWVLQYHHWRICWQKAHPERDTNRTRADWTDLEHGNALADQMASREPLQPFTLCPPPAQHSDTAFGTWRVATPDGPVEAPMGALLRFHSSKSSAQYLQTRLSRQATRRNGTPTVVHRLNWDTRLWHQCTSIPWSITVFKAKLWAHALPTRELLLRREAAADSQLTLCNLCSLSEPQTQWHVLQRCTHAELAAARSLAITSVGAVITAVADQLLVPLALRAQWQAIFEQSPGPSEPADACARYGQLPTDWLDAWWLSNGTRDMRRWRSGVTGLRSVAIACVEGCRSTWATYLRLLHPRPHRSGTAQNGHGQVRATATSPAELAVFRAFARLLKPTGWEVWTDKELARWGRDRQANARTRVGRPAPSDALSSRASARASFRSHSRRLAPATEDRAQPTLTLWLTTGSLPPARAGVG